MHAEAKLNKFSRNLIVSQIILKSVYRLYLSHTCFTDHHQDRYNYRIPALDSIDFVQVLLLLKVLTTVFSVITGASAAAIFDSRFIPRRMLLR